jgi:subtilisin family serine protease
MKVTKRAALAASLSVFAFLCGGKALAQAQRRRAPARRRRRTIRRGRLLAWRNQFLARRLANRERFELSRRGEQVVRAEILAINPSLAALAGARAQGFVELRSIGAGALGVSIVILRAPDGLGAVAAMDSLQRVDPQGVYELNHLYDPSQGLGVSGVQGKHTHSVARSCAGIKIGMIDSGLDVDHPALAQASIQRKCFTTARASTSSPHGTAVASLLVGNDDDFRGAAVGAQLFAGDVFADSVEGGSAEAVASALLWMAQQNVPVVNVSLSGPPNRALEAVCRAMTARGMIIVAAAGNEGPTKPVGFPAAYPGIVAVTAVDGENRIYLSANRGPQIVFSALGVNVEAAVDEGAYENVSGTSFAAPVVSAHLATASLTPVTAHQTLARMTASALDLGAPGRDAVYGYGLIR